MGGISNIKDGRKNTNDQKFGSVRFVLKEIHIFIQPRCIRLIKSDIKRHL